MDLARMTLRSLTVLGLMAAAGCSSPGIITNARDDAAFVESDHWLLVARGIPSSGDLTSWTDTNPPSEQAYFIVRPAISR